MIYDTQLLQLYRKVWLDAWLVHGCRLVCRSQFAHSRAHWNKLIQVDLLLCVENEMYSTRVQHKWMELRHRNRAKVRSKVRYRIFCEVLRRSCARQWPSGLRDNWSSHDTRRYRWYH